MVFHYYEAADPRNPTNLFDGTARMNNAAGLKEGPHQTSRNFPLDAL
jgi:hypothetical protein